MAEVEKRFWHYTTIGRLEQIVKSGQINLSSDVVPAAWVSSEPVWESIANKLTPYGFRYTKEQMFQMGVARIEVKFTSRYITWGKYRYNRGIDENTFYAMELLAIRNSADTKKWRATFSPIKKEEWLALEVNQEGEWVQYDPGKHKMSVEIKYLSEDDAIKLGILTRY